MTAETLPAYDMSLADHGFEPIEIKGLTYPLGEHVPGYGEIYPLAPDMGWTRMPVPGNLNHINIWLLDDRDERAGLQQRWLPIKVTAQLLDRVPAPEVTRLSM